MLHEINSIRFFQADDPDTKKQITYVIKQGDTELFSIDPKTGVIKTLRGLDYERDNQHILIIGTLENITELPGSTTRVVINVQVRNSALANPEADVIPSDRTGDQLLI